MVHKATSVLGPMKEYDLELKVLDALLSQRFWCRGKRAKWYNRRAVVLGHLTRAADTEEEKEELCRLTLEGVKDALLDEDTNIGESHFSTL